ncbi:MAG: beta-lactamase family protein [Lachnospiraceae bacterium]|nr:beta-lactamase family protein [Lachnospiraceae bacterium]
MNKFVRKVLVLVLFLVLTLGFSFAGTTQKVTGIPNASVKAESTRQPPEGRTRSLIYRFQKETGCRDCSVAVICRGEVSFYGEEEGLYQIGSMTKAFTALAVRKLISEEKLSMESNVSGYLPGFTAYYKGKKQEITVEQLLLMTSGYTNQEAVYPSAAPGMTLQDWVKSISGKELQSLPGEEYAYSNVNYDLLGAIIEQATGESYAEYMEREILEPLGLKNTYVHIPEKCDIIIPGSRLGYRQTFRYEIPVVEGRIPAGYFYSNAGDMARWLQIWLGTAEDVPEEFRELISETKSELTAEGTYTSGWEVFPYAIGHSGGTPNYSSRIVFSEENEIGVCVLTNLNVAASTDGLCNGIFQIMKGFEPEEIPTDVWTVFDKIFMFVSLAGAVMIVFHLCLKLRVGLTGSRSSKTEGNADGDQSHSLAASAGNSKNFVISKLRLALLIAGGSISLILLITVCIVMPLVFGAGLGEIAFTWAPVSFAGGLIFLGADVLVVIMRLLVLLIKRRMLQPSL